MSKLVFILLWFVKTWIGRMVLALCLIGISLIGFSVSDALIFSYIYGSWRLKNLGGPSVEEFNENKLPPWEGQIRGF